MPKAFYVTVAPASLASAMAALASAMDRWHTGTPDSSQDLIDAVKQLGKEVRAVRVGIERALGEEIEV